MHTQAISEYQQPRHANLSSESPSASITTPTRTRTIAQEARETATAHASAVAASDDPEKCVSIDVRCIANVRQEITLYYHDLRGYVMVRVSEIDHDQWACSCFTHATRHCCNHTEALGISENRACTLRVRTAALRLAARTHASINWLTEKETCDVVAGTRT